MTNPCYGMTFQKLCESKEIKLSKVSKKSGVPKSTLSRFVNGQSSLTIEQLESILDVIHIDIADFFHHAKNFQLKYYEEIFLKIDAAIIKNNKNELQKIYKENVDSEKLRHLLSLSAKARWCGLLEEEIIEISDFLISVNLFTLYELKILRHTIFELSSDLIIMLIKDIENNSPKFKNNSHYRRIICRIACASACIFVEQGNAKEVLTSINLAEQHCYETDSYQKKIVKFTKGYCSFFSEKEELTQTGIHQMKQVIMAFQKEGSIEISKIFQNFFDDKIIKNKIIEKP